MKIAMSGASGFIGSRLSQFLNHEGHEIVPLGRELFRPENEMPLCRILSTCRAVVNLAGAPIDKRWTRTYKQQLIDSRVEVTRCLTKAMKKASPSPAIFVSASAVGYYPDWGEWDEYNDVYGNDFLAHLCREWEGAARECPEGTRLVITRFGIVLSRDGGALPPAAEHTAAAARRCRHRKRATTLSLDKPARLVPGLLAAATRRQAERSLQLHRSLQHHATRTGPRPGLYRAHRPAGTDSPTVFQDTLRRTLPFYHQRAMGIPHTIAGSRIHLSPPYTEISLKGCSKSRRRKIRLPRP